MNKEQNLASLVQAFQDAANQYAVEKVSAMFNDNAEFELVPAFRVGPGQVFVFQKDMSQ